MSTNFALLTPEFLLAGVGLLVFVADFLLKGEARRGLGWVAVAGLGAALAVGLAYRWGRDETIYGGIFKADNFSLFFFAFLVVLGGAVAVASLDYVKKHVAHPGEYYGVLVFSVLGMVMMAEARELLTAWVALELLSFSLYVLVALERDRSKSNEAGVKYILLGAFSSAILVYGISMVWGALGTTTYDGIHAALASGVGLDATLKVGFGLIVAGLGFKVAAVPFHMWAPDVYEGAPSPVTAYLAVGSKSAAFALILRLFGEALLPAVGDWRALIALLAALTMLLGNLVAIVQTNIKRMLAYSSVGQVGYVLLGVAALGTVFEDGSAAPLSLASNGIMLHLVGYATANLAAFLAVIVVYNHIGSDEIKDYAGMASRSPFLAMVLAVSLFSLAGLPFFAGFVTKFYLFTAGSKAGLLWLSGLAVFASVVSLYYYLRVIQRMYIDEAPRTPAEAGSGPAFAIAIPRSSWGLLALLLAGVIVIGVWPTQLVNAIAAASRAIFPVG